MYWCWPRHPLHSVPVLASQPPHNRPGPTHWRAAAELDAAAAVLQGDAAAAAALTARAASLAKLPSSLIAGSGGGRAAAALACGAIFRRAGALAMGAAVRPLTAALTAAAVELDTRSGVHLWSLHALGVVAAHAGPGFHRQARGAMVGWCKLKPVLNAPVFSA